MKMNKKGAEESNVIIFIILALAVAGLVIWFTYGFFNKGTDLLDMNDVLTIAAVESCQQEISMNGEDGYCYSKKEVKDVQGKKIIVNCEYIAKNYRSTNFTGTTEFNCGENRFVSSQCYLLKQAEVSEKTINSTKINGIPCKSIKNSPGWKALNDGTW